MKKTNSTKRALFASLVSILLCISMLLGSTFAWFTDSVTAPNNQIIAGDLDIELYHSNRTDNGERVGESTPLFDDVTLWEPGAVAYENLKIANEGTLALEYLLSVNFTDYNTLGGKSLKDILKIALVEDTVETTGVEETDRKSAIAMGEGKFESIKDFDFKGSLEAMSTASDNDEKSLALIVWWEPSASDNDFNSNNTKTTSDGEALHINLGLKLFATQKTFESDSFGTEYDKEAGLDFYPVSTFAELKRAVEQGEENIQLTDDVYFTETVNIPSDISVKGNGYSLMRQPAVSSFSSNSLSSGFDATMLVVKNGAAVTLDNVVMDGGAVWTGEVDPVLQRGTVNSGVVATGNLISTEGNGSIVLNEGTVIQNNDGANAIYLVKSGGGSLVLNGAQIINNSSAAGAIWAGGAITINEGSKINGNSSSGIGGAIRVVSTMGTLTMNGGEMNHNKAGSNGGAIWGGNSASYIFNGGEIAYNSAVAGGAIWTGTYEKYTFAGDFELHDNTATELGGAVRFCDHTSLTVTGGKVYNNTVNGNDSAFYLNNNSATITGGVIDDNFSYSGGLGLTVGEAEISGVIEFNLSTNHKTAYLASEFSEFKFIIADPAVNAETFNFKPASDYVYTDGDENKLVYADGTYKTVWDEENLKFVLQENA